MNSLPLSPLLLCMVRTVIFMTHSEDENKFSTHNHPFFPPSYKMQKQSTQPAQWNGLNITQNSKTQRSKSWTAAWPSSWTLLSTPAHMSSPCALEGRGTERRGEERRAVRSGCTGLSFPYQFDSIFHSINPSKLRVPAVRALTSPPFSPSTTCRPLLSFFMLLCTVDKLTKSISGGRILCPPTTASLNT